MILKVDNNRETNQSNRQTKTTTKAAVVIFSGLRNIKIRFRMALIDVY
jgi:hypothetical protein